MYFLIYFFAWVAFGGVLWGCCDCGGAASAHPCEYAPEKEFSKVGMDIYVVDNINSVDEFKKKYSILYSFDYHRSGKVAIDDLTEEETMILNLSCEGKKKVVKIYNHHQDWCIHFYNLKNWVGKSGTEDLSKLLRVLIKEMGTKGGNNFDYANCRDVERWFEAWRSKVRHNKNVLIFSFNDTMKSNVENNITNTNSDAGNDIIDVGLRNDTEEKMAQIVEAFKRMVSFSYCPAILFLLGDYNEEKLRDYLVQKEDNLVVKFWNFFPPEGILSNKGWLNRGDNLVEDKIGFLKYKVDDLATYRGDLGIILRRYCYYHNASDQKIKDTHINVAITGWKRSGKTTLANTLVCGKVGKASNDFSSVTRNIAVYHHSDKSVNFSVIDTPGIEANADYAATFSEWLNTPAINDNGEFYVINEGVDFGIYKPVFFIKDSYLWVKGNNNIEEQIVENYWGKGIGRVEVPEKIRFDNNGVYPEKIDVCVKFGNDFYSFCLQWQNHSYIPKKVKLNRELIHCIVHVVSPRNFFHPKDWTYSIKDPEGPLYTDEELALFEMYEKLNIPVVVAINYINDANVAVMYLRKFFADLAISEKFVDLNNPPNYGFKSSFLSPLHSRGTILNLGFEGGPTSRSGVMRLLQVIYESIMHAKYNGWSKYNVNALNLPLAYKNNGGLEAISALFTKLNNWVLEQRFNNDATYVLGRNQWPKDDPKNMFFNPKYKYKDSFTYAFDEALSSCLDTLFNFSTVQDEEKYWNMVKEGLADVTNNWAIGNSFYYIDKNMKLDLPQGSGAVYNLTNGWQEKDEVYLL